MMMESPNGKNPSVGSPCFPNHGYAFTTQNSHNINQLTERVASSLSNVNPKDSAQSTERRSRGCSFQNILRLSLSSRIEKKMFTIDSVLEKNIKFRDENEFVDGEECRICMVSFEILKNKQFCKVCGSCVCSACCSHKVFSDKVLWYRACDLCFLKLISKEQENAQKEYFAQKDSVILNLNSELKKLNEQSKKLERSLFEFKERSAKEKKSQEEKLRELEISLSQELEINEKRSENFKRNQATLKTERDILKDLESSIQKLQTRLSMLNVEIAQKTQKCASEESKKG